MRFTKVRDVKNPVRGTPQSAGVDFFIPKFDMKFIADLQIKNNNQVNISMDDERCIVLHGHERILIPSGIHVDLPENTVLIAKNKSGVSSKKGLDVLACVVDEDYQGEVHISLINTSNSSVFLYEDEKIVQFLLFPILYSVPTRVESLEELYTDVTVRGDGGFGSTNK